jgi:hypothetical protein
MAGFWVSRSNPTPRCKSYPGHPRPILRSFGVRFNRISWTSELANADSPQLQAISICSNRIWRAIATRSNPTFSLPALRWTPSSSRHWTESHEESFTKSYYWIVPPKPFPWKASLSFAHPSFEKCELGGQVGSLSCFRIWFCFKRETLDTIFKVIDRAFPDRSRVITLDLKRNCTRARRAMRGH